MIMPERKRVIEILIIVSGVGFLLFRIFGPKMDMNQQAPMPGQGTVSVPISADASNLKEAANNLARTERDASYDTAETRDVFEKPDAYFEPNLMNPSDADIGTQEGALVLEGTICGPDRRVAILSGKVITEGTIIKGGKVIRIEQDRIIILKDGVESEIKRGI